MKIFTRVISIIALIHSTLADNTLQCGSNWTVYKDEKCFQVYDNKELQTYEESKNTCTQNEGSSLVTIYSQEEQNFVFQLIHYVHKSVNDVWIDGHIMEMSLKWSDNSTVNFTNWADSNPRNISEYECVIMSMVEPYIGKWFNVACSRKYLVVCQKTQNCLFSYLQKKVMDLSKSLENMTTELENTKKELSNTKNELENIKIESDNRYKYFENFISTLQSDIKKATPPGTVAYFAHTTAPLGWLKANGESVSRTTYANLFASIGTTFGSGDGSTTFTLPDLRGEFIRGWSDGRDVDSSRSFGTFQWGSSIPYVDQINGKATISGAIGMREFKLFAAKTFDGGFLYAYPNNFSYGMTFEKNLLYYTDANNTGNVTLYNILQGTRPRNIALLACIKY